MRNPVEIQVFVSNPSDVDHEKQVVESICDRINNQLASIHCDVRYLVKEWSKITGKFGVNPQTEIESELGNYDLYLGIWWKKFGSDTGIINPNTGKDYGSGTYREFCMAFESWNTSKNPEMYLFFKKETPTHIFDPKVITEIKRVVEFEISQQRNGFCNSFDNERDFERKITDLLWSKATQLCMGLKIENKKSFLEETTIYEITNSQSQIEIVPETYIARTTSHFSSFKEKQNIPFIELERQGLFQLIQSKNRIILLGDAGSGKSTELISLFHNLNKKESPLIPLFQKLNSYTPEKGIEEFLPKVWKKIPSQLLIIIWDGLDEIQPQHFNTAVRQINAFSNKYEEIKIIISCRTNFYELPVNNSTGTLSGFEPYLINDLTIKDASDYYQKKYNLPESDNFIQEAFNTNVDDLITRPFFLMLLADHFNREQKLSINRANLYEMFILSRIELDQNHYKSTVDLRSKKQEIIVLLQKVALSMETLSKNQINESELLLLITSKEFNSLKYCTAFKKSDGEEEIWQFEHNNIQEFLAAKALSNLDFDKVVQFISFAPKYEKLIPSWVNTLAFLFSILDPKSNLFKKLLQWMLKNEKEVIVKFEPDKVAEDLKIQIFQGIFNYYKNHDVWISSNKFSDRELARFGQSESNLRFLIEEIKNDENTRTVHINAIRLIGLFQTEDNDVKTEIENLLLEQIDGNINDPNYIHTVIYSLTWAGFTGANTIEKIMEKIGSQKNQYIRAAMYAILLKSDVLEDYVNYLIEGYELTDKKISGERNDISLMDEEWNLKECVKSIKTPNGIKEIVKYISDSTQFEYGYDSEKVIEAIVTNAVEAYGKDNSVFNSLLNWFKKDIRGFKLEKTNLVLQFFDRTNTREQAFHEIWICKEDDKEKNNSLAIAKLITPELMQFIINEYLVRNLTNKELEGIYFEMGWVNNEHRDQFENLIHEKTDFVIKKPEQIDYKALREEMLKIDFNLLFDQKAFKEATLGVFEKEKKEELSFDALFEMRKENNRWVDINEYYPSISLRLLSEFAKNSQFISKEKVMKWFEGDTNEEWYRISHIYEYIKNRKELDINSEQIQWIEQWCIANVSKVNFKEAIEVYDDGRITYKTMAMYIWYFSKRFNIDYSKSELLDMLSFDFFEGNDWIGIEYIVSKLEYKDIVDRMLENIEEGIADSSVLKNHIKYLAQNKVKESYPFILDEIINLKRSDFLRRELLDLFFEFTKDIESIKSIIDKADPMIRWAILDKLKVINQESFVEEYLLKILEKSNDNEVIGKAAEILVSLGNIKGLKAYVAWINHNVENNVDTSRVRCLNSLRTIDTIPYLIELLELSYIREIKVDRFERFNSQVLGAFYNIALVSEDNFKLVKLSLQEFMSEKSSLHENVKYILHTIERIEEQFYMNSSQSYTIKQVKEKLKLIEK
ncbi:NACHT domain-containing protein [Algoriphagus chordae]|uniref:NACHT domain-containing protein n=1 Tax=Algoriphagus chordae TaxID=237019 RepID=A0A2W7QJR9_9BACT|nr:hypothetical protein [Algoriphagus chordae]PZX47556.1 hypothetical protein LV85_03905 [Algoriphagus chordae]